MDTAAPGMERARALLVQRLFGESEGVQVGRYRLLRRIGAGGMGIVYAARDPDLDRDVAIKLIATHRDPTAPMERERLVREAQAIARVSHPNVVEVYDVGTVDAGVYVAMELVEGGTLESWLREQSRTIAEIVAAFLQVAAGLAAAHDQGMLHRDLKPDNVLAGVDGRFRVADFGLVRLLQDSDVPDVARCSDEPADLSLTRTGTMLGTPAYMAPEQHRGESLDARADQYAYCASLWRALQDAPPFRPTSFMEILHDKEEMNFAEPRGARVVPRWLDAIVRRGLQPDPSKRFADMHELARELERGSGRARRTRAALGIAAAATLATLAALSWTRRSAQVCEAADPQVADAWTTDVRARVGDALRRGGPGTANRASELVRSLDDYVVALESAREGSCRLAADDPAQGVASTRCLAEARARLLVVIDTLERADAKVADRATEILDTLVVPGTCLTATSIEGESVADGRSADLRERLAPFHVVGAASGLVGRSAELVALAAEADEIGDWRPRAEAQVLLCRALEADAHDEEAIAACETGFFLAHEHGLGTTEHIAAAKLAHLVGVRLGRRDEGLVWAAHAEAAIERHALGEQRTAQLDATVCVLHERHGDRDAALRHCSRSVEVAERIADDRLLGVALIDLARVQGALGRHEDALRSRQRAVEVLTRVIGADNPITAVALFGVGQSLATLRRLDEAEVPIREALTVLERIHGSQHPRVIAVTNELAYVLWEQADLVGARDMFARALEGARDLTAPGDVVMRAGVRRNLADVEYRLGHLDEARVHAEAAVEALDAMQNAEEGQIAHALHVLACATLARGQVEIGRSALRRAHTLANEKDPEILGLIAFADAQFSADESDATARARTAADLLAPGFADRTALIVRWLDGDTREPWARDALAQGLCVRADELLSSRPSGPD